jgi:hypothetical protein
VTILDGARTSTAGWSVTIKPSRIIHLASKGRPARDPEGPRYGNKTIYVKDWSRWDQLMELAQKRGQSVSDLIGEAIDRMLSKENAAEYKITQIRRILDGD